MIQPNEARLEKGSKSALPLLALLAVVAALAAFGAFLAADMFWRGAPVDVPVDPRTGPFGVGQSVPTSFGVVAVEHAEKVPGLTPKELAGMTHGIQGMVSPDKVRVQAGVTWTNMRHQTVDYSPGQFRLITSKSKEPISVSSSSIRPGTLQPSASVDAVLNFVAPRDGSQLWLEFRDRGNAQPIRIDLGRTDRTPADAFEGSHDQGSHEHDKEMPDGHHHK